MKAKNYFTTKRICFLATFSALITVATMIIQIPSPGGQGYINVGDTLIFVCAVFFDPFFAFIAGGLGSALADIFAGWVVYAPFTFAIKGIEGFLCALLISLFKKMKFKNIISFAIAMLVAGLWMSMGYFVADLVLYGWGMAVANLPFNFVQGGVNVVLGFVLSITLTKIKGVRGILSLEKGE